MEFSNAYALAPDVRLGDQDAFFSFATFYHEDGTRARGRRLRRGPLGDRPRPADGARSTPSSTRPTPTCSAAMRLAAAELLPALRPDRHRPVYRPLPGHPAARGHRAGHRRAPYRRRRLRDLGARLYAAGDAATRELICGGFTGGGSHNAAWAISSGTWAGPGRGPARRLARPPDRAPPGQRPGRRGSAAHRQARPARCGARGRGRRAGRGAARTSRILLRHGDRLAPALAELRQHLERAARLAVRRRRRGGRGRPAGGGAGRARPLDVHRGAWPGTETRGMHKREDRPRRDPSSAAAAAGQRAGRDPGPAPTRSRRRPAYAGLRAAS